VSLEAGEEKTVEIALSKHAYTVVNDEGERVPGSGKYAVYCGFSQPDARSEALTGKKCMKI
jgi:beta-glucosidase